MDREFATQRGAGNGRFAWWVPARLEIVLIWLANISHVYYFTKVDARLSSAHSLILVWFRAIAHDLSGDMETTLTLEQEEDI